MCRVCGSQASFALLMLTFSLVFALGVTGSDV